MIPNSMYLSSDHFSSTFRLSEFKIGKTITRNSVLVEVCSSLRLESAKTRETSANHVRATQILPGQVCSGLLARLTTLIKNEYGLKNVSIKKNILKIPNPSLSKY